MVPDCSRTVTAALLAVTLLTTLPWTVALAAQHGLVVGINEYQYRDRFPQKLKSLEGAVNDARLLTQALRMAGASLPRERFLINDQATRDNVVRAWRTMVKAAEPGDTLIFTYAGHGGQVPDIKPKDEADGLDEVLMLHDFGTNEAHGGLISDDELYGMFQDASDYHIVFLADTCYSGGLARSLAAPELSGRSRSGGQWDISVDRPTARPTLEASGDEGRNLPHVTLISAAQSEHLQVNETSFNGTVHGALSWFFAQALLGKGSDVNGDAKLSRKELKAWLENRVRTYTHNTQQPRLRPRGDDSVVVVLGQPEAESLSPRPTGPAVTIRVEGGQLPSGLTGAQLVAEQPQVLFRLQGRSAEVFNRTGDKVAEIAATDRAAWQRVIDKYLLIQTLDQSLNPRLYPVEMRLQEGDNLHRTGEVLHFTVQPGGERESLPALTLFDLTGDGTLQFLYPLERYSDSKTVSRYPFELPQMKVQPPYGGDTLVAVVCREPPNNLHSLLKDYDQAAPPPAQAALKTLEGNVCQVGRYDFFTAAKE